MAGLPRLLPHLRKQCLRFYLQRLLTNADKGRTAIYQRVLLAAFSKPSHTFAVVRFAMATKLNLVRRFPTQLAPTD